MIFHGVPLQCINDAALRYHIPAAIILSVIKAEGGKNGQSNKNKNGSYDLGVMQVNTIWLSKLVHYGITKKSLQNDPCINVVVGTWILARGLAQSTGWQGVGNYHSFTPVHNARYRQKIEKHYRRYCAYMKEI